jgi:hypothetical protein
MSAVECQVFAVECQVFADTPLLHKGLSVFPSNPLVESSKPIKVKNNLVATKMRNDLIDPSTGEQHTHALVHTLSVVDDAHFVKVLKATLSPLKNRVGLTQYKSRSLGLKNRLFRRPFKPLKKSTYGLL